MADNREYSVGSGINLLAGIWLIIAPFAMHFSSVAQTINSILVGIAVGIIALARVASGGEAGWLSWINIALGLWLIVSSFVFGIGNVGEMSYWNSIVLGIIVAVMAVWSLLAAKSGGKLVS